jgi:hypothetical protein
VIRELDRAYLKRPGRGVPPPRSGPPPLVAVLGTYKRHELPELLVCIYENSGRTWGGQLVFPLPTLHHAMSLASNDIGMVRS